MSPPVKPWLITGGCGFIGANLIERLASESLAIRVFDNESTGHAIPAPPVQFIHGDIRDPEALATAVAGCDVVVHLAAQSGVIPSVEDPRRDFELNAVGTLNVLMACRDAGVRKLVFASSNAVLGDVPTPYEETRAARPLSPYGASKQAGEAYCLAFHASFGLQTVALRFANAYGPHSLHKNSVIHKWSRTILEGQPLIVFDDGGQTRDFIYVGDMCEAIIASGRGDISGEIFQVASGTETTISTLLDIFRSVAGREIEVEFRHARRGEARAIWASIDKARQKLGFSPKVGLEEGVRQTFEWFKANYQPEAAREAVL